MYCATIGDLQSGLIVVRGWHAGLGSFINLANHRLVEICSVFCYTITVCINTFT